MKTIRKIIEINEELCDGCGNCVPVCAEGALQIVDGKARVVADIYCDGLGACLGECPNGALRIVERQAEDFDEKAVEQYLEIAAKPGPGQTHLDAGGCPSTGLHIFSSPTSQAESSADGVERESALAHWPVQIMLVPPTAPFLKGANLLVLADCVPVAFPTLHRDFIKGKSVLMGCPKLDDVQYYIEKFAQIFKLAGIKSITAVVMEVPCCSGLPMIVKKGMESAGVQIPLEQVVVSTRGKILKRTQIKAA
jgi:Pyruvate/2-oxoacid:ferredoxin oxidoreductase delta subunit